MNKTGHTAALSEQSTHLTTGCEEKRLRFDGKALNEKEQIWKKLHILLCASATYGHNQHRGRA